MQALGGAIGVVPEESTFLLSWWFLLPCLLVNGLAAYLFLQGTRDALATIDLIEKVSKPLKKAKLVKLEGADHSFKAGKKDIMSELVAATKEWIAKQFS